MNKLSFYKKFVYLIFIAVLLISCSEEKVQEELIRTVRYKQVSFAGGGSSRTFTGSAKVGVESALSFKVPGTIKRINVKVGDVVKKGQLLAALDDTDFRFQVKEAEAGVREAESQLTNAKNSYDRSKKLYENNTAPKSELDNARSAYESASAAVERLKNSLQLARLQLDYTKITAPLGGSIAVSDFENNENVQAGQTIAVLIVGRDMEVNLGLPENVINRITKGMNVSITFPSLKGNNYDGIVSEVSPSMDLNSSTYPVSIKVLVSSSRIKSGMAANVTFSFGDGSTNEILVVPVSSVGEDSKGRFVFVVEGAEGEVGSVKKQHIEIGKLTSNGFEVLSGLELNNSVATAGLQTLKDGQKVRL